MAINRFIPACAGNSATAAPRRPGAPVHPRVCGELPSTGCGIGERRRFIPACAGNSRYLLPLASAQAVHPRVCGELRTSPGGSVCHTGSSPRVRGTRWAVAAAGQHWGFIPACAGNSLRRSLLPIKIPVHPRVCGELPEFIYQRARRYGSSPRVRGTRGVGRGECQGIRFIPACAGNSRTPPAPASNRTVHPRVCGELSIAAKDPLAASGSSPRVRGTPAAGHPRQAAHRFIPACAGNSRWCRGGRRSTAVHPRVCGELIAPVWRPRLKAGSSPRVRGTRLDVPQPSVRRRFIPACAGNSSASCRASSVTTVHPRVCGELYGDPARVWADCGSSPRVRGTPAASRLRALRRRFIPACAGNSASASRC